MSLEPEKASEKIAEEGLGSFRGCLVEGDAEQRRRERRIRRRALLISVLLQSAALTLLVLVPLFAKTERIALKDFVPIPPYGHPSSHPRGSTKPAPNRPANPGNPYVFPSPRSKPQPQTNGEVGPIGPPDLGPDGNQKIDGQDCNWCVNTGDKNNGPRPPQPPPDTRVKPQIVHMTQLDPAMLIHRVEPLYPPLARQTHREGRVELRAIIGTDGTIQSLQIVTGDPLFQLSAREAVQQWRYRPTILNGQAVEVDTYITVIYTMPH